MTGTSRPTRTEAWGTTLWTPSSSTQPAPQEAKAAEVIWPTRRSCRLLRREEEEEDWKTCRNSETSRSLSTSTATSSGAPRSSVEEGTLAETTALRFSIPFAASTRRREATRTFTCLFISRARSVCFSFERRRLVPAISGPFCLLHVFLTLGFAFLSHCVFLRFV